MPGGPGACEVDRLVGWWYRFGRPFDRFKSAVRALDGTTGALRWEHEVKAVTIAGVLSTAGDLVFSGASDGFFFALDAETGEVLWRINLGGPV